jgi:transposase
MGTRPPYPAEYRAEIVRQVRARRTPEELAREHEPSAQTIRNWVLYRCLRKTHYPDVRIMPTCTGGALRERPRGRVGSA